MYIINLIFNSCVLGEKPLVECSFITEFEDHIFVTVDAEAFFFLHDLITSYHSEKERVVNCLFVLFIFIFNFIFIYFKLFLLVCNAKCRSIKSIQPRSAG